MPIDDVTGPPDPSHDDVSNAGPQREAGIPEFDNDAHDRNDDGPEAPASVPPEPRAPEEKITGKPISDMAPPGQDGIGGGTDQEPATEPPLDESGFSQGA